LFQGVQQLFARDQSQLGRTRRRLMGMSLHRRDFIAGSMAGGLLLGLNARAASAAQVKKIAFIGTEMRTLAHSQHFFDRLTMGYNWAGEWKRPRVQVASLYLDQRPRGDLSAARAKRFGVKVTTTIADALTLGGSQLAVDGVVIIAEQGKYPKNEKGQTLYPRYEFFKQIVKVFESSGRSVPVFNDKHLSTSWDHCVEMVNDSKRLDFPFLAGSSLPVTWRLPQIDMPYDAPLVESVCVGYGGVDSYDFHGLETAQCMSERRKGGEYGIKRVHVLKGARLWEAMDSSDRDVTRRLMVAALNRSHNLPVTTGYVSEPVSYEWAKKTMPDMIGYLIEHVDGFRTTHFIAPIRDFNYAGLRRDTNEVISCQMYLPMPGASSTTADFFNPLTRHIEDLVLNRKANYPIERTLLTSGMVIGAVESLHRGQVPFETPEMKVVYKAPRESMFRTV
jgi:hypothetical protein